mmetsp:Transcript_9853/g.23227  ORF Transcript_9853/g.23227 Transcript_9853/m.23227 type:complete len:227 (+) Transcript_9853:1494-2174(+)
MGSHVLLPCLFPFIAIVNQDFFVLVDISESNKIDLKASQPFVSEFINRFLQPFLPSHGIAPNNSGIGVLGRVIDERSQKPIWTKEECGISVTKTVVQYQLVSRGTIHIRNNFPFLLVVANLDLGSLVHFQDVHVPDMDQWCRSDKSSSRNEAIGKCPAAGMWGLLTHARFDIVHALSMLVEPFQISSAAIIVSVGCPAIIQDVFNFASIIGKCVKNSRCLPNGSKV